MDELQADVLIIGAGPAGLSAAMEISERRRNALIIDDNPQAGGQIWREGPNAKQTADAVRFKTVLKRKRIKILTGARVVGVANRRTLLLETADQAMQVTYKTLILCTGARELMLPFPGWTLPGVTGAGGLQALIKSGYDINGESVVVAGSGPLLLATAQQVSQAGARIEIIAEQTSLAALARFTGKLIGWPSKLGQSVKLASRRYRWGVHVAEALGTDKLEAVRLQYGNGKQRTIDCDRLACGYGLVPNTELADLLGCRTRQDGVVVDGRQMTSQSGIFAAGECTGIGGKELSIMEGRIAGMQVADPRPVDEATRMARNTWQKFAHTLARTFALDEKLKELAQPDTFICRCEDVRRRELDGEPDWVTAKLESRCGMGACQGRICGPVTEFLYDWNRPPPRLPVFPARVETLAGNAIDDTSNGNDSRP